MQISIELQYFHSSIQISFALSEYDSSVFSVGTSPANHQIYATYFLLSCFWYFVFMQCSTGAVQCLQIFCGVVQCADKTLAVLVQCSKSVPTTSLIHSPAPYLYQILNFWKAIHKIRIRELLYIYCIYTIGKQTRSQKSAMGECYGGLGVKLPES